MKKLNNIGPATCNSNDRLDDSVTDQVDGTRFWYQNGKLHRENGPAVEYADGTRLWYQNGQMHRLDGPAIEYLDGTKYWCHKGLLHRLDGPAVEYADGKKQFYLNDTEYSVQDFLFKIKGNYGNKDY